MQTLIINLCPAFASYHKWMGWLELHRSDSSLRMDCVCAVSMSYMIRHKEQMSSSFSRGRKTCFHYGKRVGMGRASYNDWTESTGCIMPAGPGSVILFARSMETQISLLFARDLQDM